jgi:hypothetical protein
MEIVMQELKYRCCFCNMLIESDNVNPCDLNILINIDKPKDKQDNQTFYCHIACFKEKLHEEIKKLLIVHLVDDE